MSSKCIFCYTDIPKCTPKKPPDIMAMAFSSSSLFPENSLEPEVQGQPPQKSLLSKNLDVIFILRNIFKVPLTQLSSYLKSCPDIENWITTCVNCDKIVKEFTTFYRKCQETKWALINKVKDICGKDIDDFETILDITDECRRFVVKNEVPKSYNHFIEGDLKAERLMKSGSHPIRMETDLNEKSPGQPDFDIDYPNDDNHFEDNEKPKKPKRIRNRKLKCPQANCTSQFNRRPELNRHLLEVHNSQPPPPKPAIHQRKYPNEYYVYSETNKVQFVAKIPSKCDLCLKEFSSQETLATHLKNMEEILTKRAKYHCKTCGKGIHLLQSLKKHVARCPSTINSTRRLPSSKNEALICPVENCGIIFKTSTSLEIHYRHHHREMDQRPCTVENCPEKFYTEGGLEYHLKNKHNEDKPFRCNHCGRGFTSKFLLEGHKKRVVEREQFEKDPLAFTSAVICNYCGRTFPNEDSLRGHVRRVHERSLKYKCEHCGNGMDGAERLNIHLWKVHGRRDIPLKWRCEVEGCGRICYTGKQLELHMTRHEGTPQFCCEECGKEFYDKQHLKEHVMAMHESRKGGEKVKCEVCGMEFEYWKYMIRHRKTVHENKKRKPKKKLEPEVEQRSDIKINLQV